jgi:hypothetical protein
VTLFFFIQTSDLFRILGFGFRIFAGIDDQPNL